jgi:hypothetical protein
MGACLLATAFRPSVPVLAQVPPTPGVPFPGPTDPTPPVRPFSGTPFPPAPVLTPQAPIADVTHPLLIPQPTFSLPTPIPSGKAGIHTILIPDVVLTYPGGKPPGTIAEDFALVTALANGQPCATVALTGTSSRSSQGKVIELGSTGQPAACRQDGARIQLLDGTGRELGTEFVLKRGSTHQLFNFGPKPPHTGDGEGIGEQISLPEAAESSESVTWPKQSTLGVIAVSTGGLFAVSGFLLVTRKKR